MVPGLRGPDSPGFWLVELVAAPGTGRRMGSGLSLLIVTCPHTSSFLSSQDTGAEASRTGTGLAF